MKKLVLGITALAAVALISCKKTEPVAPAEPGTCTVSGNVWAALDLSNDTTDAGTFIAGLNNEAVDGQTITFVVNSGDLDHNPEPGFDYQDLSYSATISGGTYSIEIPAISTPYTVDVYLNDFNYEQRQFNGADPEAIYQTTEFFVNPTTISGISDGVSKVQNFTYLY